MICLKIATQQSVKPFARVIVYKEYVQAKTMRTEGRVEGCRPYIFVLRATASYIFYNCRLSVHTCGFNISLLHFDFVI